MWGQVRQINKVKLRGVGINIIIAIALAFHAIWCFINSSGYFYFLLKIKNHGSCMYCVALHLMDLMAAD